MSSNSQELPSTNGLWKDLHPESSDPYNRTFKEVLQALIYEDQLTPDGCTLEQNPLHLLFVCDELQTVGAKNWWLQDDELVAFGAVTVRPFELFKPSNEHRSCDAMSSRASHAQDSGQSVLMDRPSELTRRPSTPAHLRAPVVGELWLVSTRTLRVLDREVYYNTLKWERFKEDIRLLTEPLIPDYANGRRVFSAWVYFGTPCFHEHLISAGHHNRVEPSYHAGTPHQPYASLF